MEKLISQERNMNSLKKFLNFVLKTIFLEIIIF